MTNQRELDRMLGDFFVPGTNELADRVIDAALTEIEHLEQRRPIWAPRSYAPRGFSTRFAVAAVIGVIAVGGAVYAFKPPQSQSGAPSPTTLRTPISTAHASTSPVAGTWTATGSMSNRREGEPTATRLLDGRVLVAGGYSRGYNVGANVTAELYDPTTGSWTRAAAMDRQRGAGHTATLLADGRVLVLGGEHGAEGSAEIYDPASAAWTSVAPMLEARSGHSATLLADGRVLVAGGAEAPSGGFQGSGLAEASLASAELFDPVSGSWSAAMPMSVDRTGHTATLLPDGRVLVAGGAIEVLGSNGPKPLDSTELYDPATGSWTTTGPMTAVRYGQVALLLPNGTVISLGGYSDTGLVPFAELFDPAGETWTVGPRIALGISTATLLADGRLLITGWPGATGSPNPSWLYDSAGGTVTATAPMLEARSSGTGDYTATLLLDGTVLIAGGEGDVFDMSGNESFPELTTTELYHPAPRP
jgi:Galactose oxidase, central domain/Kelch motif